MTSETEPSAVIAQVLTAAEVRRDRVPLLLGLFDVGDRQVRLGAATALCVVAEEHPEIVPSLVGRLVDRADGENGLAAGLVFEYLAVRYPDAVESALDEPVRESSPLHDHDRANPTREDLGNRDVGRTRAAGSGPAADPQQVYTDDDDNTLAAEPGRGAGDDEGDGSTIRQRPRAADARWLAVIEAESRFDRLRVLAARDPRRYGATYRTRGTIDETDRAVALRLLRDGGDDLSPLDTRLEDWRSVADTDNVVTLYDWGRRPRRWMATEYTAQRLADRDRFAPSEAAWHAEQLATAVAAIHEAGVVHAGIDPQSVAYYGNVLEEDERQPPLLDNVGLLQFYRHHLDPAELLNPRYAAPEYYERRYGRIDHATDVYQLGAVCYRLFTGQPPYTGGFGAVRDAVLDRGPPVPSDVADVPEAVDDIVGKAMATGKLTRYETAAHLGQELRRLPLEDSDE